MKLKRGQTIIELLIAFTVIAIGLFSAVNLIYGNLALVDRDTDEVMAVNLAREGVELAKQLRDSNWLAGTYFDAGMSNPSNPTDYTATPLWDGLGIGPSFDFTANTATDTNATVVKPRDGFFANLGPGVSGTGTVFTRLVTFHPICKDNTAVNSGSDCGVSPAATYPKIGVRVESRVHWVRKTTPHDTTIYEDLYDWR